MSYEMDTDGTAQKDVDSKKISFRFCRECSNMLYPKEDAQESVLMFACRSCQYSEPATAACIYRNSLQEQIAETAGNVEDVAQDPTVGDHDDIDDDDDDDYPSAYSTAQDSFMQDDADNMEESGGRMPDMCTLCGQEILCPLCGGASDNGVALEVDDPDRAKDAEQERELVDREKRERALSSAGGRVS